MDYRYELYIDAKRTLFYFPSPSFLERYSTFFLLVFLDDRPCGSPLKTRNRNYKAFWMKLCAFFPS